MKLPGGLKSSVIVVALLLCALFQLNAQEMVLDYLYRYDCQKDYPDHLMAVKKVSGGRAIVASNRGLALIRLSDLLPHGTENYIDRLVHINARNLYTQHEPYIYVNLNRGENEASTGFCIIELNGDTLSLLNTVDETNVIYEKMFIRDDYLYVTAHSKGIRIFDITDRVNPVMVGRIDDGFVDAFSIHVDGNTAYVADGAGGLKIVDVTDKTAPTIIDGDDLATAEGTSQDVTMKDGHVYVAAGGAGLAIYQDGDLTKRTHRHCGGCAKHFAWMGEDLAMTTMWRVLVFRLDGLGGVEVVASENISRRGIESQLRTCGGIGAIYDDLLMTANWDFMDVYKLRPAAECTKADINCWPQRIRFKPSGGKERVWVQNNSYLPLLT